MVQALEERRYVSRGGGLSTKHEAMGERLSLLLQHFSVTHGIPWHHFNTHTYEKLHRHGCTGVARRGEGASLGEGG